MATALRRYYRGHNLVTLREVPTAQSRVYHFDHQGTTQCLTDSTGAVTDRFASDAWGVQVKRTGSSLNRQWYVGRSGYYWSPRVRHLYVRARYYHAAYGGWESRDPLSSLHAYDYVRSRATLYIDPSGYEGCPPERQSCCGQFNLGLLQQSVTRGGIAQLCRGGSWQKCEGMIGPIRAQTQATCMNGKQDCGSLGKRLEEVLLGCAGSCRGQLPQEDRDFSAFAFTACCRETLIIGQTKRFGACKMCGFFCCDVEFHREPLTNSCVRECLFQHEEEHQRQCTQLGRCAPEFGKYSRQSALQDECGSYHVEAQCLLTALLNNGCNLTEETSKLVNSCDAGRRRNGPPVRSLALQMTLRAGQGTRV